MTATVTTAPEFATAHPAPSLGKRLWNVVKMQAANPWQSIYLPITIMTVVFGMHLAIWALIANLAGGVDNLEEGAFRTSGGASWVAVYLMVVAIQAMNATFKFALGLSVTRRDYFWGTALFFGLLSAGFAAWITVMAAIERATDGWGLNAVFFAPVPLTTQPLWMVGYTWLLFLLLMFGIGIASASIFVRWKTTGILTMFGVLALALIGSLWLITWADGWGAVGRFLTETSLLSMVSGTLVATTVFTAAGFLLLRRAAPGQ